MKNAQISFITLALCFLLVPFVFAKEVGLKAERYLSKSIMPADETGAFAKRHSSSNYDKSLRLKTFSWTSGQIKHIPLNDKSSIQSQYKRSAFKYLEKVGGFHGANKSSIKHSKLIDFHDTGRGGIIARFQQEVNGIDVFGRNLNLLLNRNNKLLVSSGYYSHSSKVKTKTSTLKEEKAIAIAFKENTGQSLKASQITLNMQNEDYKLATIHEDFTPNHLLKTSRLKTVFYPIENDKLLLAYYVEIETSRKGSLNSKYFSYVIDAESGKVLFSNNLTSHVTTTYKVFADDSTHFPFDGPQGISLSPHPTGQVEDTPQLGQTFVTQNTVTLDHGPISTQDPWLPISATTTLGNNIDAYADVSGDQGFDGVDVRPEMTGPNSFEYDFATFNEGLSGDARNHAVVNLFYVTNFLHDWFYNNGFDEESGNAQFSNYGRGGIEGDRMLVEAQDFSGFNNANMSTPADGGAPRMQLFVFNTLVDRSVEIDGVDNIELGSAIFGPQEFDVSGQLILVDDNVAPIGDGCESLDANLTGLIAIIDRGNCNFTVKVINAQDSGAAGVIIVNNNPGEGVIQMGGENPSITIPSVFISLEKGNEIKSVLSTNANLEASLSVVRLPLDGSLDNAVIAHEWAHYLTQRLVGNANGLSNSQGGGLGEGWSDFVALLMMVREEDNLIAGNENYQGVYSAASFIANAYYGLRRVPYSTDINKNALTFRHIEDGVSLPLNHPVAFDVGGATNSAVHQTGEVWATMLWEAFISLVNSPNHSFDSARESMKDYLVASLKLTPNAPTLTEARDALLAVILANDSSDFQRVKEAFIKRGMGAGAVAPSRYSSDHQGVVEDFTPDVDIGMTFTQVKEGESQDACDNDDVWDEGESALFKLQFKSFSDEIIPPFNVSLNSVNDVTFDTPVLSVPQLDNFADTSELTFRAILNAAAFMDNIDIEAMLDEVGASPQEFNEPLPASVNLSANFDYSKQRFIDNMELVSASEFDWHTVVDNPQLTAFKVESGSWRGRNNAIAGTSDLITPEIEVASSGDFVIRFNHFYFFESSDDESGTMRNWDGGVIEVSIDGGQWTDVISLGASLQQPYNGVVDDSNSFLGGRAAYTFTRDPSDLALTENSITFLDGAVNGSNIRVRFRIGSDADTGDFGWQIDSVSVVNAASPMFSNIVEENNNCDADNSEPTEPSPPISDQNSGGGTVFYSLLLLLGVLGYRRYLYKF